MGNLTKKLDKIPSNSTIDFEAEQRYSDQPTGGDKDWAEFLDTVCLILMNYKHKKEENDNG